MLTAISSPTITFAHLTEWALPSIHQNTEQSMIRKPLVVLVLALVGIGTGCQETGKDCLSGNWLSDNEDCNMSKRIVFNSDGTGTYEYNACDSLCPSDASMWYALRNFTYTADEDVVFLDYAIGTVYSCDSMVLPMIDAVNTAYVCTDDNLTVGSVSYTRE